MSEVETTQNDEPEISEDEKLFNELSEKKEIEEESSDVILDPEIEDEEKKDEENLDSDKEEEEDEEEEEKPNEPAWFAGMTDEDKELARTDMGLLRHENQHLDLRYKSQHGQLKPVQQQNERLRKQNAALIELTKATTGAPNAQQEKVEQWIKKHGEDYPTEAEELRNLVTGLVDQAETENKDLRERITQEPTTTEKVDTDEQTDLLIQLHPEAAEMGEDPRFKHWMGTQDDTTKGALQSEVANDVADVLERFKQQNPDWHPPQEPDDFLTARQAVVSPLFQEWSRAWNVEPSTLMQMSEFEQAGVMKNFKDDLAEAKKPVTPEVDDKTKRIAEKREKQRLDRNPGSKGSGVDTGNLPDSEEALFDYQIKNHPALQEKG